MIRHKAKWLLVGLMCLPLWPGTTHGHSDALTNAYNRYSEFYAEGRYQEAIPFAKKALELGEDLLDPDDPIMAILLNDLAVLYQAQGHYAEATPLHQRALSIKEKALGPEHPEVATILNNYGRMLRANGRDAEAAKIEARAKIMRTNHPEWSAQQRGFFDRPFGR